MSESFFEKISAAFKATDRVKNQANNYFSSNVSGVKIKQDFFKKVPISSAKEFLKPKFQCLFDFQNQKLIEVLQRYPLNC
jgi:hypothetical protein